MGFCSCSYEVGSGEGERHICHSPAAAHLAQAKERRVLSLSGAALPETERESSHLLQEWQG